MTDKEKRENAPNDEIVPAPKPKKVAAAQEDPQDDDDEQKEEERRQRQEKVKKRKEEMRRKAEQKRKQEQEEEDEGLEEDQPPRKTKPAAKQPIRENVVNNSVMFLNHPKVKSAPMSQKIAYLQKKGLTQEEIQETIERAGESVPANTPGFSQSASSQSYTNPALPPRPSNYYGPQVPPPGYPPQPYPQQQMIPVPPPQQTWYGGKLGLAITIASCVGIGMGFSYVAKNYISPWLFSRPDKEETKQREEYQTKVFEEMLQSLKSMQQSNTELKDYMKTQGELKDLIKTALDTKTTTTTSLTQSGARDLERMKIAEMEAELKKMKAMMVDTKSLQSSTSSSYQTWNPTESKIPAWQRSVSSSAPSVNTNPTPQSVDSFKSPAKETIPVTSPTSTSPNSPDPVPQSYAQILDMVRNGQLPDDIKDIDDKPREPFTPIEKGERESRPKPWEKKAEPAPASPSIPTNAAQANGQPQTETKPEVKPEEVVS